MSLRQRSVGRSERETRLFDAVHRCELLVGGTRNDRPVRAERNHSRLAHGTTDRSDVGVGERLHPGVGVR